MNVALAKAGELIVKVRMTGSTYVARSGRGKDAVTASCTSGQELAAISCGIKALGGVPRQALKAVEVRDPESLPGLRVKKEYGLSFWKVGFSVEHGGVL